MTADARQPMRVMAMVGEGVFAPVLDSQVLAPLRFIGQRAPHIQRAVLILTSLRSMFQSAVSDRQRAIRAALPDGQVIFRYRLPYNAPYQTWRWSRRLDAAIRACGYTGDAPIIVHCRGQGVALAAIASKRRDPRLRVLLDLRGDSADEAERAPHSRVAAANTRRDALEAAMQGADGLNTVSEKLVDHVRAKCDFDRDVPRTVVGCCADTQRFYYDPALRAARRQALGLADKFVVCYCGSMSHWQRPDQIAAAYAAIQQTMPDAHLLILSREADALVAQLRELNVPADRYTATSAPHDQVASYLMAADVALLLRENILTNLVASPVKFSEYLRCGLPVILTPYIGDFSAFADQHRIGRSIEFPVVPEEAVAAARELRTRLDAEGDALRQRCSEIAGAHFSWDVQIEKLIGLYEQLSR